MEVVEHCIGSHLENDGNRKRIRLDINDKEDEQLSECESESSEVLSVGSEPTPCTSDNNIISETKDCKTTEYVTNNLASSRLEYHQTELINKSINSNSNSNSNSNLILSSSSSSSSSRTPSPSPSNESSCNLPQSPHSYCSIQQQPLSPTASLSIRSSASSNTIALSPSRSTTDVTQEAIIFKYQNTATSALSHQQQSPQQLLSRYSIGESTSELRSEYNSAISRMPPHSIVQELSYSTASAIEKQIHNHRTLTTTPTTTAPPTNLPLMTRISLSPPLVTATTGLSGLQVTTPTPVFHPSCRNNPRSDASLILHPVHLHVNSHSHSLLHHHQTQGQHLSVTNILQSSTHQHHKENQQVIQSRSSFNNNNKISRSSPIREQNKSPILSRDNHESTINNHSDNNLQNSPNNIYHRHNNISNDNDIQASLKFSIDNILKADFGRRITDPISLKKSRTKKVNQTPIDLTKDFVESSSENNSSERPTDITTNSSSIKTPSNTPITNVNNSPGATSGTDTKQMLWPAWVYCTRYSDRPSSGRSPRTRRVKRTSEPRTSSSSSGNGASSNQDEKRPRTAFSGEQLARLKREFAENRYLTERRRQQLSRDLGLNEAQIKIWFQNKRAKIKKASGQKNPLALQLMAQGLYNHSTVPLTKEEEDQAAELEDRVKQRFDKCSDADSHSAINNKLGRIRRQHCANSTTTKQNQNVPLENINHSEEKI